MASCQISAMEGFDNCMLLLKEESNSEHLQNTLQTIQKILKNIKEHPTHEKYRKLRKENASFKEKIWRLEGAQQFLFAVGFVNADDVIVLLDDEKLDAGLESVEQALRENSKEVHSSKTTNPSSGSESQFSEKDKELLEKRKQQLKALEREKAEKKRINDQIKADRRDVNGRQMQDSHARQMKFGSNMKSFKDIGVDLNRGGG